MLLRKTKAQYVEAALLVMTFSRLFLAFGLAMATQRSVAESAVWLMVVIVADIFDGVIARQFGDDTVWRRITDAAVDRLSIWVVFAVALQGRETLWLFYLPLAIRGLILSTGSLLCFWRKRTVTIGGRWHKASSLSLAAFGLALLVGNENLVWATAIPAWVINWVLLFDYLPIQVAILGQPPSVSTSLEPTRVSIRRLEGLRSVSRSWRK